MKELWLHLLLFSLPPFGLPCFFTNVPVLLASARTAWLLAKLLEGKVKWKSLSRVQLFSTPWTIQSMRFFRPEYWSGLPCSSPGDLSSPRIKPRSPTLQADSLPMEPPGKPNGRGALLLIQSCKLGVSQVQVPYVRRWISQQIIIMSEWLIDLLFWGIRLHHQFLCPWYWSESNHCLKWSKTSDWLDHNLVILFIWTWLRPKENIAPNSCFSPLYVMTQRVSGAWSYTTLHSCVQSASADDLSVEHQAGTGLL